VVVIDRVPQRAGMGYPLQHDPAVNDDLVQPDAAQRHGGIAGQHQRQPPRQRRVPDLGNNRSDPEALQARRQRKAGNPSPYDQNPRPVRHHGTIASTTRRRNSTDGEDARAQQVVLAGFALTLRLRSVTALRQLSSLAVAVRLAAVTARRNCCQPVQA